MVDAARERVVRAPGRVNLIGDHTDYAEGFVLPMAIDRACTVRCTPVDGTRVRVTSRQLAGPVDVAADGHDDPRSVEPRWGGFVAGAISSVSRRGASVPGLDLDVSSTVPAGSGLSSSSALAVAALTVALADAGGVELEPDDIARSALEAEVLATGVPGGLMDQLASVHGVAGHALLIDCRTLGVEPIPLPAELAVLVVHSGVPRTLAGSAYARRGATEAAAARLGLPTLRDATIDQVGDDPFARHVVTENARVLAFADALRTHDLDALGPLLLQSHASLRDDFAVSTPELDLLVDLLVDHGARGARLTGAGFGGCVVALVQRNHADDVAAKVVVRYGADTGLDALAFTVRATDGAAFVA